MSHSSRRYGQLLERALAGSHEALGALLESYREYLRLLADREIGARLQARVDPSDIVQQTYLSAWKNFGEFQGGTIAEFFVWLHQIHKRNCQDAVRDNVRIAKRAVGREERMGDGSGRVQLCGVASSPSQRAVRDELSQELVNAVHVLDVDQREAVRLRYLEGNSVAEIAVTLDKSQAAVAGLLFRGLKALRARYRPSE